MITLPHYSILKFDSSRLEENNYNLNISIEQAIENKEIVELSSSQTIRKIRELSSTLKIDFKAPYGLVHADYMQECIIIHVEAKKHYRHVKTHGVIVNGKKYIRFMCGMSHARNSNVILIQEELQKRLHEIMCCGVDRDISIVPNKWNAYYALNSSSSYPIDSPRVCIIPDYKKQLKKEFDWIDYIPETKDYEITRKIIDVEGYAPWDGMGLVDIEFAKRIASNIELDYIPSAFVIRNTWIKGLVSVMDFNKFSQRFSTDGKLIKDLWGNEHYIQDVDMILTESQFKLWNGYKSWNDYLENMEKYNLGWGVSRFSPKKDKTHAFTNYQFLQVLDLNEENIKNVCEPTLNWIRDIMGADTMKSLLYMCGTEKEININNISDKSMLALIYNNKLISDSYIKSKIVRSINKKIREAYSGKLIVDGNFSFMVSDPFGLLQYAMGLEVTGLLDDYEHYSGFWNDRNVCKVGAMRSPLTHFSEANVLNLKKNEETEEWYKYINSGCVVYNIFGDDTFRHADSDKTLSVSGEPRNLGCVIYV